MSIPVVIGLDISLTNTGMAGILSETGFGWSCHFGKEGHNSASWPERFARIDEAVKAIVTTAYDRVSAIDLLVCEGPAPSRATGHLWDRAGVWHKAVDEFTLRGVPVAIVGPNSRAKWATGRGNAGKDDVIEHMVRRYGHVWTTFHGSNDEADAAALCTAGLWVLGFPVAQVPQVHADALKAVTWPLVSQIQDAAL